MKKYLWIPLLTIFLFNACESTQPQNVPANNNPAQDSRVLPHDLSGVSPLNLYGQQLEGVWVDTETNNHVTIEKKGYQYVVSSQVDQDDGEVMKIMFSQWRNGTLQWQYFVPSTGYYVQFTTLEINGDQLYCHWSNQYSQGEENLVRYGSDSGYYGYEDYSNVLPHPMSTIYPLNLSGQQLEGTWVDTETNNYITVQQQGNQYVVTSQVDQDDGEVMEIIFTKWMNGVLQWQYYVPSTGYYVQFTSMEINGDELICYWSNWESSGTERLVRATDDYYGDYGYGDGDYSNVVPHDMSMVAPLNLSGSKLEGVWTDTETNNYITVTRQGNFYKVTSQVDQDDGEVMEIIFTEWNNGTLQWKYYVPSTGYYVQFTTLSIGSNTLECFWSNWESSGRETLQRVK